MRTRTVPGRSMEIPPASGLGLVPHRVNIKQDEGCGGRMALFWFTTAFTLGLACLGCRNPDDVAPRPADRFARPQASKTATDVNITDTLAEKKRADQAIPTPLSGSNERDAHTASVKRSLDPVPKGDKDPSEPAALERKGMTALTPPTLAANTAEGSGRLPTTVVVPANPATLPQAARGDMGRDAPVATPEQTVMLTPSTQTVHGANNPDGLPATTGRPANQVALVPVTASTTGPGAPRTIRERPATLAPPPEAAPAAKAPEASRATTENPADQAALAQVARKDKDWSVRKAAVERLTIQAVLAQVATLDEDVDIRILAVSRLTAQAALAKVATSDQNWSVRKVATEMLTDQSTLARIARNDEDADIRKLAVSLLTDQNALARIARSDKDWTVRRAAVDKVTNRVVLAQVATSDLDVDIRKLAVGKLADPSVTP